MTEVDERDFLCFLRETGDIQIFKEDAPTKAELQVRSFGPRRGGERSFWIWNRVFPFKPRVARISDKADSGKGYYYLDNTDDTPLLQYHRHNFDAHLGTYGRLHWSKDSAAPDGLTYDVDAFERWYAAVVRWVRKRGRRRGKAFLGTFFLPDAWARHGVRPETSG